MEQFNSKRDIARHVKNSGMMCNCDLDKWEPERDTGHSHVCMIHNEVKNGIRDGKYKIVEKV